MEGRAPRGRRRRTWPRGSSALHAAGMRYGVTAPAFASERNATSDSGLPRMKYPFRFRPGSLSATPLLLSLRASAADAAIAARPRATPESKGIASAGIEAILDEADAKQYGLHSLMILRHGKVVAEGWWAPYAANEPHMLFSLSKSFTSTAIGMAVADGKVALEDPILKFFPTEAPAEPSANLKAMRVRDLLTMSTGQH